jgi:hypothetical protein
MLQKHCQPVWGVRCLLLRTITLPNLWNVTRCVARNAVSGTTKYALVRKARDSSLVVHVTNHNRTTRWSELYLQRYFSITYKKFSNFCIISILNIVTWKNLTYSSSYTQHVSALILYLLLVFYALKIVLSEMIEICHKKCTLLTRDISSYNIVPGDKHSCTAVWITQTITVRIMLHCAFSDCFLNTRHADRNCQLSHRPIWFCSKLQPVLIFWMAKYWN